MEAKKKQCRPNKLFYEPPIARDLSLAMARGQNAPASTCGNGSSPGGGSCLTGLLPLTPSVCNPTGANPIISGCNAGLIATPVRCANGSFPMHS